MNKNPLIICVFCQRFDARKRGGNKFRTRPFLTRASRSPASPVPVCGVHVQVWRRPVFSNLVCSNIKLRLSRVEAPASGRPSPRSCWSWVGQTAALCHCRCLPSDCPPCRVNFDTHSREARGPRCSVQTRCGLQYQNYLRFEKHSWHR